MLHVQGYGDGVNGDIEVILACHSAIHYVKISSQVSRHTCRHRNTTPKGLLVSFVTTGSFAPNSMKYHKESIII